MQKELSIKFGLKWMEFYYEKLNERYDLDWAICETYNKFIVNGGK